jgi:hypothetical protein
MQAAIGRTIKFAAVLLTVLSVTTPALADGWRGGWGGRGGYGWHGGDWHGGGFGWRGYGRRFYGGRFGFGIGFPGWHGLPIYGWYPPPPLPRQIVYVVPRPQPPQAVYANSPPPAPSPPLAVFPKPKPPHHVVHHAAVHHPYCHCCCCCGVKMGDAPKSDPPKNNPKMGGDPIGDPPKKIVDGHLLHWNQAGQYISIQQMEATNK